MLDDGAGGVESGLVVVAGFEEGVVEAALQLKTGFEDFRGDVDDRGGEIGDETLTSKSALMQGPFSWKAKLTTSKIGKRMVYANVNQMPFTPFIATEEYECPRERAQKCRSDSAVETSPEALLPEDLEVG